MLESLFGEDLMPGSNALARQETSVCCELDMPGLASLKVNVVLARMKNATLAGFFARVKADTFQISDPTIYPIPNTLALQGSRTRCHGFIARYLSIRQASSEDQDNTVCPFLLNHKRCSNCHQAGTLIAAFMKMKAFIVHRFKKRKLYSSNREANEILWAPSAMNVAKDRVCSCFAWMFLVSYPCYSFRHALYS